MTVTKGVANMSATTKLFFTPNAVMLPSFAICHVGHTSFSRETECVV